MLMCWQVPRWNQCAQHKNEYISADQDPKDYSLTRKKPNQPPENICSDELIDALIMSKRVTEIMLSQPNHLRWTMTKKKRNSFGKIITGSWSLMSLIGNTWNMKTLKMVNNYFVSQEINWVTDVKDLLNNQTN